jgi:hypothetical protein
MTYPKDILYMNILAEVYLKNGEQTKAHYFFDKAVIKDKRNDGVTAIRKISHRVICNECFKQIRGIREKCTDRGCQNYDCCRLCLHEQRGILHPCVQGKHILISIPSPEACKQMAPKLRSVSI